MRKTFADEISKYDVTVLTADLGFGLWSEKNKVINVGSSECSMVGAAIGYALEGKRAVCYSITPFLLYRPFEWIRYINHHKIPTILVGSGRGDNYKHDGASHHVFEDREIMSVMKNIKSFWPETKEEIPSLVDKIINSNKPTYINLKR